MRCCKVCLLLDGRSDSDSNMEPRISRDCGNLTLHLKLLGWSVCLSVHCSSSTLWELDFQMSCDFDWGVCSAFSQTLVMSLLQKVMASRWETLLTLVADSCVLEFSLNTIISGLPSSLDAYSSSSTSSDFSLQLNFPCMFLCSTLQTTDTSINDPRWLGGSQCAIRTSVQSTAFLWLWLELISLIWIFDLSIFPLAFPNCFFFFYISDTWFYSQAANHNH